MHLQMIESSAHGDEYDGVIFSQLVRLDLFHSIIYDAIKLECTILININTMIQNLIDLAGSESSKTETTGLRRKEGSYINKSLLTLGTVGVFFVAFVCCLNIFALFFSPNKYNCTSRIYVILL